MLNNFDCYRRTKVYRKSLQPARQSANFPAVIDTPSSNKLPESKSTHIVPDRCHHHRGTSTIHQHITLSDFLLETWHRIYSIGRGHNNVTPNRKLRQYFNPLSFFPYSSCCTYDTSCNPFPASCRIDLARYARQIVDTRGGNEINGTQYNNHHITNVETLPSPCCCLTRWVGWMAEKISRLWLDRWPASYDHLMGFCLPGQGCQIFIEKKKYY